MDPVFDDGVPPEPVPEEEEEDEGDESLSSEDDEPDVCWLFRGRDEPDEQLPALLAGTARRRKTVETYVAPPRLCETVQRCREFPSGVYIDRHGRMQPDDPRSGVYRWWSGPAPAERPDPEDEDDDDEEEEEDDDDEEDPESEFVPDEDDEEESEEEEEDEEEEEEDEDEAEGDSPRRKRLLADLERGQRETDATLERDRKRQRQRILSQERIEWTQRVIGEWNALGRSKLRGLDLVFDSNLHAVHEPWFRCRVLTRERAELVRFELDLDKMVLRSPGGWEVETGEELWRFATGAT